MTPNQLAFLDSILNETVPEAVPSAAAIETTRLRNHAQRGDIELIEAVTARDMWRDRARGLEVERDELETRYNEAGRIAAQYAQAIGEYQASNDRYRLALLAVLATDSYEAAERVAREALGP